MQELYQGRNPHTLIDTMGLLLGVSITAADVLERPGAKTLSIRIESYSHNIYLASKNVGGWKIVE